MFNTQLVQILKSFTVYELNSFKKFVASPFFNMKEELCVFLGLLGKYHPGFDKKDISREFIFSKLFPGKKFDDKKIRYLTYDLINLAKKYMEYSNFKKDKFLPHYRMMMELQERKLETLFEKTLKEVQNILNPRDFGRVEYFQYSYLFQNLTYSYEFLVIDKKIESDGFIKEAEYLICYFLILLSRHTYNLYVNAKGNNNKFPYNPAQAFIANLDLKKLIEYSKKGGSSIYSEYEIYYHLMMLQVNEDDEVHFYRLKEMSTWYTRTLNKFDIHNFYTNLESYCIRRIKKDRLDFKFEQFEIYKKMLLHKIHPLEEGDYFPAHLFSNIVRSAVRVNEMNWALEFLSDYGKLLHPGVKEEIINICSAQVYFAMKDHEKAAGYFAKIKSNVESFKNDIYSLAIKLYYEMNLFDSAIDTIDSFRHYLDKNKFVSEFWKNTYTPFVRYAGELIKIKSDYYRNKNERIEIIEKKITGTMPLSNKEWLLEKLKEISEEKI